MPSPEDDDDAIYGDDPQHPLPQLESLDMVGKRRDGGADLMMLVNGPLSDDTRSQQRLMRKFDIYLGFIASPQFRTEFGAPDPETTAVVVRLGAKSAPAIFQLLKRCEPWVREGQATLIVETAAD